MNQYSLEVIRNQIVGNDLLFDTPFGERHLLYADYTASGRGLQTIEEKIWNIEKSYANTHTEDDYSGKYLTRLLHQAESKIKELVNAGPDGKIIMIGSGTTGALKKLQEIIGVYIPPVTRERFTKSSGETYTTESKILESRDKERPVVCRFKPALPPLPGPGESACFISEQLRLNQCGRKGGTIECHQRSLPPR